MAEIPVSEYYSVRHPKEFDEACERATREGWLDLWTWAMLLGAVAPPDPPEWAQRNRQQDFATRQYGRAGK